jgi:predicted secreted Zn-dependent protease
MMMLCRRSLLHGAVALGAVLLNLLPASLASAATPADDLSPADSGLPSSVAALLPADVQPDVRLIRDVAYYDLIGSTAGALQTGIARSGPRDSTGAWAAATSWALNWSLRHSPVLDGCGLAAAAVNVSTQVVLPRWRRPTNAPDRLVGQWSRYLAALTEHERGHEQIALQAGAELLVGLRNLTSAGSCGELDGGVQSLANSIVARYESEQRRYDAETNHGATQGAVFP